MTARYASIDFGKPTLIPTTQERPTSFHAKEGWILEGEWPVFLLEHPKKGVRFLVQGLPAVCVPLPEDVPAPVETKPESPKGKGR